MTDLKCSKYCGISFISACRILLDLNYCIDDFLLFTLYSVVYYRNPISGYRVVHRNGVPVAK